MVKAKLKELGIKLGELSEALMLSRPTLDSYIECYDKEMEIPKKKYQIIFDELFGDSINTKQDFMDILTRYSNMLKRDMDIGILDFSPEDSDLINSIMDKINEDIQTESFDKHIYLYINTMLNNYKNDSLFKMMAKYILYLNNTININEINHNEKLFVSNLYEVLNDYKHNNLKYKDENYKEFIKRTKEIQKKQEEYSKQTSEEIKYHLEQQIDAELKKGIRFEDIDINKIIMQIANERSK